MCFGSKSKGEHTSNYDNLNARPVEAKPTRNSSIKMPKPNEYTPPLGPSPSHQHQQTYAPPAGPPNRNESEYAPPPEPPRSQDYPPPAGPPPGQATYHDWQTAVPDTSLLPPPPSLGNQRSRTNNATEQQAEQGEAWCQQNPLSAPVYLPQAAIEAIDRGEIRIVKPRDYKGGLDRPRPGVWAGKTKSDSPDSCITSAIPLYSVIAHSPLKTGCSRTIYYEVRIPSRNRREVSLALGYGASPYPTFRLPGWHRGCLAVHGDDGSKFINDRWGGKDFTTPFKPGETVGLGMTFTARDTNAPPSYGPAQTTTSIPINVQIFFTRNGRKDGGWNLHEEGDSQEDLPVFGLEGLNDIYAVIGTFENVEFEIVFNPSEWMYHP
ncbi:hypothetical protein G7Y89_g15642 [Cudoniella acicularis]|uniref:SPRY domain-containing protein n=1 Tax=Cudoniella acicularis TaxID=354080 RepID=A0A8H4QIG4_9HELO|nr:hypothetical protein G7Y89_g15642 [Cudoniella acicularis]